MVFVVFTASCICSGGEVDRFCICTVLHANKMNSFPAPRFDCIIEPNDKSVRDTIAKNWAELETLDGKDMV